MGAPIILGVTALLIGAAYTIAVQRRLNETLHDDAHDVAYGDWISLPIVHAPTADFIPLHTGSIARD
jgi:hypothetical protein